ncbi:MAG TPA: 50S ribosomal protein L31 [Longimicrobium sp.]|nr:50S ribosomal protein L31 [Longimicrobium sp.]
MKPDIHPNYKPATMHCACGNTFQTRTTGGDISVEVCSNCHPYYTGKQKLMDTAGRVERFRQRYAAK